MGNRFEFADCDYGSANAGANVTLVASAANTKGIYVRMLNINSAAAGTCGFAIGAQDVAILQNGNLSFEDFYVPANVDFILKSSAANNKVMCYYKALT